jgi:ribosomal protein L20
MVRVSNGLQRQRSHKKYLKAAKGFRLGRSKVYNQAKDALVKQ